ncbi:MAG TPA: hypothetical protein VLD84_06330 [Nitrososphaeraceae archaeon]|nr:hypothetical protein [Nitrososphaeraceae archaeon]
MMNNSRQIVSISLLLGTIIAVSAFSIVFNSIPVEALHKEEQFLENFDDLADYAKAVRNGDSDFEEIPIQSMKQADIYDDANDSLKDCIDQAAEIGDSLTDREVVHCVDNVNYFNNKYSNSTVPTTETSTSTTGLNTGTDTTSTSNADTNTADTNTADTNTADTNTADTTSTSDNSNKNTLVDELVKTGKFTEAEAKEFVNNNMQSGTGTDTTSDTTSTSNADTTSTSNADTKTDSSASDDTSTNNEDNNDQSSNNNSNNPEDYGGLDELVKDIKNGNIDTEEISLSAFQNSGAYQGADQETQDCIDLAGKIGHNLGDQEIVNCSEDPNFYKNEISNNNDNNADDSNNNADDSNNNADENSDSSNDNNN